MSSIARRLVSRRLVLTVLFAGVTVLILGAVHAVAVKAGFTSNIRLTASGASTTAAVDVVASNGPTSPTNNEMAFTSSCDGHMLAYSSGRGLFLIRADGTGEVPLRGFPNSVFDDFAVASPDGSFLIFTSFKNFGEHNTTGDIFRVNPDGSGLTNLTNSPDTRFSSRGAFSPDGSKIVFTSSREIESCPSQTGCNAPLDIFVMNSDGTGKSNLTNFPGDGRQFHQPSFSPNGNQIVFVGDTTDGELNTESIFTINIDGTGLTRVTPPITDFDPERSSPRYNADGSLIYFLSNELSRESRKELLAISSSGSVPARLTDQGDVRSYDFSPDGSRITYGAFFSGSNPGSHVVVMNADGSNQVNLTPTSASDDSPIYSSDGTRIAFLSNRQPGSQSSNLHIMNSDGTGVTPALSPMFSGDLLTLDFFVSDTDQDGVSNPCDNCPLSSNSDQADNDLDAVGDVCDTDDDNDGILDENDNCPLTHIPDQINTDGDSQGNVCDADDDNDGVPDSADNCPLVPNPQKILFVTSRDGNNEIYVVNLNGTGAQRLTNHTATDTSPRYSQATNKIVFVSTRDGNNEIYTMDPDGSNVTRITNNPRTDRNASFSPDGTKIIFESDRDAVTPTGFHFEVYVMNADGTNQTRLTNTPTNAFNRAVSAHASYSPDGSRIVFTSDRDSSVGFGYQNEIYLMNPDGTGVVRLTNAPRSDFNPAYSTDGSKIAFTSDRDSSNEREIYVMNADGSNQTRLTTNSALEHSPSFSPDGRQIAFVSSRDDGRDHVFVMNADGSNQIRLMSNSAADFSPSYLPQLDSDGDGVGDACDFGNTDSDGDGIADQADNCPLVSNFNQLDTDGDAQGDACDPDDDNDGIVDNSDNCAVVANSDQSNNDSDQFGDACDSDDDNDSVADAADNCPLTANSSQSNNEGDTEGDACDSDDDNDGSLDPVDNCALLANIDQANNDGDSLGDVCDSDDDNDGVIDAEDNCPLAANPSPIAFHSARDGGGFDIYVMSADASALTRLTFDQTNTNPSFSHDGNRIVFTSTRDGDHEIFVMNSDGTGQTRLTNNSAYDDRPSFSPDGTRVLFYSNRDDNSEIYVINADGSGETRLTFGQGADVNPSFSPDRSQILFANLSSGAFDVYLMNADGSGRVNLTNHVGQDSDPAFSLDGDRIVFASDRDGNSEIYAMNSDGTGVTRLTNNATHEFNPAFSRDGSRIAFRSGNDLYLINADGTNQTQLTNHPALDNAPSFGPQLDADADGAGDACESDDDNDGIPDATDNCAVIGNSDQANNDGDQFGDVCDSDDDNDGTPDDTDNCPGAINGARIAFESTRDGNSEIYVMNADGTGVVRLTDNSATDAAPSFSLDGSRIVFTSLRDGNSEVYVMNADGSNQIRLTNNPGTDTRASFNGDGGRITFQSNRDGNSEIYVMNDDGSAQTRLTDNPASDSTPSFSVDSSRIAFSSFRDANQEIYVMNADGSNVTRLTNNSAADRDPIFSPNGSRIAFHTDRDGNFEVYVMNADGSAPINLSNTPGSDSDPTFSGDGNRIAFESTREGNANVYIMNADGTGQTRLTDQQMSDLGPSISGQLNIDGDSQGNACDADDDDDGVLDNTDNCPITANADQTDSNGNGRGDACEVVFDTDSDADGISDATDNCRLTANANQADTDADGVGNACDNANLRITKHDSENSVLVGGSFTYILNIKNLGPTSAEGIVMIDSLPNGLTFNSLSITGILGVPVNGAACAYNSSSHTVTCNINAMSKPGEATININVTGAQAGKYINTASVSSSSSDPNLANNTDSQTTHVVTVKSVKVQPAKVTGGAQCPTQPTLTVVLTGPAPATGVAVSVFDDLDATTNVPASGAPMIMNVPAGANNQTFSVATANVAEEATGIVTAMLGGVSVTDTLTVRPIGVSSVTLNPNSVQGGGTSEGIVTLDCAAPAGGVTVTIVSNKPNVAQLKTSAGSPPLPSITVTIPQGATSGSFIVQANAVSASKTAAIKATANDIAKSAQLTVTP
jgi:uncharacterized repeat protein (TIGR01451 family)